MATEAIIVDVGTLYKRLFNHRPIIQNEVNYFVKEFETKREDSDFKVLQDAMSKADEINNVFLTEIMCSNPHFKTIREKAGTIKDNCEEILSREKKDLWISQEKQEKLDQQLEKYRGQLKQKEQDIVSANEQEIAKLKAQIEELRESRTKMRSHNSSLSSSITIYPSASTSPVEEGEGSEREPEEGKEATPDPEEEGEGQEAIPDHPEGQEEGEDPEQQEKAKEKAAGKSPEVSGPETGQGTPE